MKTKKQKQNWFMSLAFRGNCMCVLLLVPTARLDSCCEIDGVFYEDGTVNPDNSCELCDISRSIHSWSSVAEGTSCDYCLHCDAQGACGEVDDNCCNTASANHGTCEDAPAMLLKEGCVFSHDLAGVQNELSSGIYIDLVCEADGVFDLLSIAHSTIQYCPGCPDELWEYWSVSECDVEYNSGDLTCTGSSSDVSMTDVVCTGTAADTSGSVCESVNSTVAQAEKRFSADISADVMDCVACPACCSNETMKYACSDELLTDTSDNCIYVTQCFTMDTDTWLKRTTRAFCLSDGQVPEDITSGPGHDRTHAMTGKPSPR